MSLYREMIKNDYERRLKINPRCSLRSYAKTLGIAVSRLSCILNDQQTISMLSANKIADKLPLNAEEKELFLASAMSDDKRSKRNRIEGLKRLKKVKSIEQREVDNDVFSIVSDWYHYAILELIQTSGFIKSHEWIAKRLGLNSFQIEQAVKRLKKMNLIIETEDSYKYSGTSLTTQADVPSEEIRKFNRQILGLALNAVDTQSVLERDFSTLTIGLDTRLIPQFKQMIAKFRSEVNTLAEAIPEKDRSEVYMLSLNFFRLTHQDIFVEKNSQMVH